MIPRCLIHLPLGLLLALAACGTTPDQPPPQTVAALDLQRYLGTWFEVARLPNSFQDSRGRRCVATTATYALEQEGRIGITNRCLDAADGNREVVATGRAEVVEGSNNAKLSVTFFWPFRGDYWVIGLDPRYRWAVVGSPDRQSLWILSRTPFLSAGDYAEAVGIAAMQGYEVSRLQPTPQPAHQLVSPQEPWGRRQGMGQPDQG